MGKASRSYMTCCDYVFLFSAVLVFVSFNCFASFTSSTEELSAEKTPKVSTGLVEYTTEYIEGFSAGFVEEVYEDIICLALMFLHPYDTFKEMVSAFYHYQETAILIQSSVNEVLDAYPGYTSWQRGRIQAMTLVEIVWMFMPIHIPFNVGQLHPGFLVAAEKINAPLKVVKSKLNKRLPAVSNPILLGIAEQVNPAGIAEWFVPE